MILLTGRTSRESDQMKSRSRPFDKTDCRNGNRVMAVWRWSGVQACLHEEHDKS
jgi:hypothetical protein